MHGGGDVGVSVSGLLDGSVPQHLRDQLQLFLVLEYGCGEGVPKVVESDIRPACLLKQRLVGAAVEVVAAHDSAGSRREDEAAGRRAWYSGVCVYKNKQSGSSAWQKTMGVVQHTARYGCGSCWCGQPAPPTARLPDRSLVT